MFKVLYCTVLLFCVDLNKRTHKRITLRLWSRQDARQLTTTSWPIRTRCHKIILRNAVLYVPVEPMLVSNLRALYVHFHRVQRYSATQNSLVQEVVCPCIWSSFRLLSSHRVGTAGTIIILSCSTNPYVKQKQSSLSCHHQLQWVPVLVLVL